MSLSCFYKSTHIRKEKNKKKKLWQHWNAPRHANGAYRKKKRVGCSLVHCGALATDRDPVHAAAGLLTCRKSAAQPGPPSEAWECRVGGWGGQLAVLTGTGGTWRWELDVYPLLARVRLHPEAALVI